MPLTTLTRQCRLILVSLLACLNLSAQSDLPKEARQIVAEGKLLYKAELASWHGTDLFLEQYKNRENIGGYFSYTDNNQPKCVFFSSAETPKVIGTISFDTAYTLSTAQVDLKEREFSAGEKALYVIRKVALEEINSNADGLFKFYENTNYNIIPLISEKEKKVYVLTGPAKGGVVILGNDYLLTFDNDNKLVTKKPLHKNIIPINYGPAQDGKEILGTMHNHSPETGDYITATDICTLMLYHKYTKWKTHNVLSQSYLNIWDGETSQLTLVSKDALEKIDKDQKERKGQGK